MKKNLFAMTIVLAVVCVAANATTLLEYNNLADGVAGDLLLNINDDSGNGNGATQVFAWELKSKLVTDVPTWATGTLSMQGGKGGHHEYLNGNAAINDVTAGFTWEVSTKFTEDPNDGYGGIDMNPQVMGTVGDWFTGVHDPLENVGEGMYMTVTAGGSLRVWSRAGSGMWSDNSLIADDEWHHLAVSFIATSGPDANGETIGAYTGTAKLYLDGNLVMTKTDFKLLPSTYGINIFSANGKTPWAPSGGLDILNRVRISSGTLEPSEFTNIPEPATMSLIALGGLALIRRKK